MKKTELYAQISETIQKAEYWLIKNEELYAYKYINKAATLLLEADTNRNTKKLHDYLERVSDKIVKKFYRR